MSLETVRFNYLTLQPGQRLLDLGCGEGRHAISACLQEQVVSVGIDLKLDDIVTTRKRYLEIADQQTPGQLVLSVSSGDRLPFADNTFDQVICSEVLEHIPNYEQVLMEIDRVLKPDGRLAISVPRYWTEWVCWRLSSAYHEVEGGHIRIFKTTALIREIETLGFKKRKQHWAHALHVPYWWLKCLFWGKEDPWVLRLYHRFLVWDLMSAPAVTHWLEKLLNPILGKSVVLYFDR
ncbi:MAG: class I SAM-dependent methyltransferase [Gammaproteobacteria bacterium]|nr:class I SAM-dependent methyltransferase [Gammaproteobacteria bacterium]